MSVELLTTSLRTAVEFNDETQSTTVKRVCAAFQLLDSLATLPATVLHGSFNLAHRVVLSSNGNTGSIVQWNHDSSTLNLMMDTGEKVSNIAVNDITEFAESTSDNNKRLDFVSRVVWVNALSENRIPLNGVHLDAELGPWTFFEQAFQLTTPWGEDLWKAKPTLVALNFEWWLCLFAESSRTKLKGADYLALLMIEEAYKNLAAVEEVWITADLTSDAANVVVPVDDLVASFVEGVAELVTYYPPAVLALGTSAAAASSAPAATTADSSTSGFSAGGNVSGCFTLLRHMVSTQALKVIRAVYRKPKTDQYNIDRQLLLQRFKFFLDLQKVSEDELRSRQCASVFGDGQSQWNAGWLYSLNSSDPKTVCHYLRQGVALADAGSNDFVSAKARWDLAGTLLLGGEGELYDIREVKALREDAERFEQMVAPLGMKFYIQGESIFAKLVMGQLQQFTGKGPFMRPPLRVQQGSYSDKGLSACHFCQRGTESLKACGSCKRIRYCSRECQKSDFKVHKKVCKKLQQATKK